MKIDAGRKSKYVFNSLDGLYIKDHRTPWTSEKAWTNLSKQGCERRARIAGLGEDIVDPGPESANKYGILLEEDERPLIDDQGHLRYYGAVYSSSSSSSARFGSSAADS